VKRSGQMGGAVVVVHAVGPKNAGTGASRLQPATEGSRTEDLAPLMDRVHRQHLGLGDSVAVALIVALVSASTRTVSTSNGTVRTPRTSTDEASVRATPGFVEISETTTSPGAAGHSTSPCRLPSRRPPLGSGVRATDLGPIA